MTRALRKLFVQDFEKKVGTDIINFIIMFSKYVSSWFRLLVFLEAIMWMTTSLQW